MDSVIEIVDAITVEIEKLNQQDLEHFSGDTLSRIGVRLAAYKAGLGKHSTIAKRATWMAEKAFKDAKAQEFQRLRADGKSAADANELKTLEVGAEYMEYIEAQVLEDRITTLSINVHDLIDSIKSRLIFCQMEKQENKIY
jgi:hypothetical protein